MSSLNTNVAAMTALQTLTATNKSLTETQNRISTGLRVSDASDNAAYWSIATTMRSDSAALSTVQDALGLGAATVDVAYTGLQKAIDIVDQIKTKLVAASQPGLDRAKIQTEIGELQKELTSIGQSASFSGENWLSVDSSVSGYSANKQVVASFSRNATGVSIGTIDIDTSKTKLFDASAAAGADGILDASRNATGAIDAAGTFSVSTLSISAATTDAELTGFIAGAEAALKEMTDAATTLGAAKARVGVQQDFVKSLKDAIGRGVGQLVDADMNEESTRLQALQVKQQLGVQALSIANSSTQTILSLFR